MSHFLRSSNRLFAFVLVLSVFSLVLGTKGYGQHRRYGEGSIGCGRSRRKGDGDRCRAWYLTSDQDKHDR